MSGRSQDAVLERKLFLPIFDCEADLGTVHVEKAFVVLRKGQPKMMGALSSPSISKTTKSLGTYDCPT